MSQLVIRKLSKEEVLLGLHLSHEDIDWLLGVVKKLQEPKKRQIIRNMEAEQLPIDDFIKKYA